VSSHALVVVSPHRFRDLEPERTILTPLGATVRACETLDEFAEASIGADALLVAAAPRVDAAAIASLERCRAIVRYGVGVNNIDLRAAASAGIPVANVVDASTQEVADHALGLGLNLLRRLPATHEAMRQGGWPASAMRGVRRLSELTCGIIGTGRIGTATGRRFEALGMRVLAHDPYPGPADWDYVDLPALLDQADVVSLHLPLTERTHHLLGREELAMMRSSAVLLNVSRGGLVDEDALVDALNGGRLAGAALDAFEHEPLPSDHPLRTAANALLTPHVAYASDEAAREIQTKAAEEVARVLQGMPLRHPVQGAA
jgi:D-3-phosphoglycerate dehydrogenase